VNDELVRALVARSLDGAQNEERREAASTPASRSEISVEEARRYLDARYRRVLDTRGPVRPRWTLLDAQAVRKLLDADVLRREG
jgi:hypothetical protein